MWPHSFELTNIIYQLDYGVGSKFQNIEQFRTAFRGTDDSFLISGLMPRYLYALIHLNENRTKYRLRICPILPKESEQQKSNPLDTKEETIGPWSEIVTVVTKDIQTIDSQTPLCAIVTMQGRETIVDFEKAGRISAKNEYEFGKVAWEIRIPQQIAHQTPVDSSSFIKIGVTNKVGKTYNIFGSLINYALNTESMIIKVFLDLEKRTMTIINGNNKDGEVFNNLPNGPLYPAFQNKTSKDSFSPLKLHIKFDLPYILNEAKE